MGRRLRTLKRGKRQVRRACGDPSDPDGLFVYMQRYLSWMEVRGYSEVSVWNAERYLREFIAWCDVRGLARPHEITKPILDAYQRRLFYYRKADGKPLSFHSQSAHLVPVKGYFKWLARENHILFNPASELDLPRLPRRLPRFVLTASEAERVLAQPRTDDVLGVRDRAVLEVLYSTGIRRRELVHLKVWDVDAERGTLHVRQGKGRKDRIVPIGARALQWIGTYLDDVRPRLVVPPDEGTLFLTRTGEYFNDSWLSRTVAKYVDAAHLNKRGSCHLFRHTMATLMLDNGADVRFIQAILGHADLTSTEIYTQVAIKRLKAVHDLTHPAKPASAGERQAQAQDDDDRQALLARLSAEANEEDGL